MIEGWSEVKVLGGGDGDCGGEAMGGGEGEKGKNGKIGRLICRANLR